MRVSKGLSIANLSTSARKVIRFYVDGFKSMTIGKSLWVLILVKLFLLFAVLKLFFFPDLLKENYDNDHDRAEAVRTALINEP